MGDFYGWFFYGFKRVSFRVLIFSDDYYIFFCNNLRNVDMDLLRVIV